MRRWRRAVAWLLLLLLAAGGGGWLYLQQSIHQDDLFDLFGPAPDGHDAFTKWLGQDPRRAEQIAAFEVYLADQGMDGIVPTWEMTRVDAGYARRCGLGYFAMPPRELWPNIVPALKLVRDHVVPAVGPVEVLSSFRTPDVNACVHGASGSKHLVFEALDLATRDDRRDSTLYRDLCAMHRAAGPSSSMGLGAYFNPRRPERATGRFHIDGRGYRSWGHDYTKATNPCPALLGQ